MRRHQSPKIATATAAAATATNLTTTLITATTTATATAKRQWLQQGATAEAARATMAAVRAMAVVMTAATAGAMVTAMAAVHLVSTAASAASAMQQQSLLRLPQQHDTNTKTNTTTNKRTNMEGFGMILQFFFTHGKTGGCTLLRSRDFPGCESWILKSAGIIPYWSFGDTIPVPTVARVHFLSSKLWYKKLPALVAMLFC